MDCFLSGLAGLVLARSQDAVVLGNDFLSSFVAVSGDAHQAKVAQDLFRQEVRYERSLQIREDIRDVNKCMMESVQTHVLMGSIILAVCFSMSIEGYPGVRTERLLDLLWLLLTSWASTFTFVALWLALRFQMKISGSARERLLRRHRFMVPDDLVVGKMGGENLVNQMANFHSWVLETMDDMVSAQTDEETLREKCQPIFLKQAARPLRVPVESLDSNDIDAEPLRKGFHAWHHESGKGYSQNKTLEVPYFLVGETCVRMQWLMLANGPSLKMRVYGDATLYVSAQVFPGDAVLPQPSERKSKTSHTSGGSSPQSPVSAAGVRKALRLESTVPAWPADELPLVRTGFNEKWRGESGYGEFRRVEGFSIFVDTQNAMELPLYKIVLASPSDFDEEYIDVVIQWNFKTACEALTVVLRRGHVHCKEEDFPLFEFNTEVKKMLPLRRYAGNFLAEGTICLLVATCLLMTGRMYNFNITAGIPWAFEVALSFVALLPGCVLLRIMPVETAQSEVLQIAEMNEPKQSFFTQFRRTMSGHAMNRSGRDLGMAMKRLNSRDSGAARSDSAGSELDEENYTSDLADRLAAMEALDRSGSEDEESAIVREGDLQGASPSSVSAPRTEMSSMSFGCCSPESAPCREVIQAASSKVNAVTTSCQNVWRVPPDSHAGTKRYRRRVSAYSDPRTYAKTKAPETRAARAKNSLKALWADLNHGLERPRSLQFWTAILHSMFGLSLLSVFVAAGPSFCVRTVLAFVPEGSRHQAQLSWVALPTEWPPFFQPTAAAWAGSTLVAASGGILQKFAAVESGWYQPVGPVLTVPGNVRGMGLMDEHVAVISDEGVFRTAELNSSWINSTSGDASEGPLGLLMQSDEAVAAAALLPPAAAGVELSAASLSGGDLPGTAAVAVVGSDGLLRLCRLPSAPGEPLEVLLELTLGLGQVQGLRLCRAAACGSNEAVLWVADSEGSVHAISLDSGDIRATFTADLPTRGARVVALSGNSSHLAALLVLDSLEPQLVAAQYPVLPRTSAVEL
ncbi:hypothetical protein AK812_SmicGene15485 [Symbiodinium microadriaticum]|uniref:Uncharacterized protein n=1 Tax=Symbiodinium microadriaticum TaxID=2951 RepID=A0A1Q9E2X3_SYMMI|nr:hypothetical protein AK812_SmicGene15485 [Symbiodinium microadriaticum]